MFLNYMDSTNYAGHYIILPFSLDNELIIINRAWAEQAGGAL